MIYYVNSAWSNPIISLMTLLTRGSMNFLVNLTLLDEKYFNIEKSVLGKFTCFFN